MIATNRIKEDPTGNLEPVFNTVAMDITSFCNLKCPFCLSSHDQPNVFMSKEIFDKAISLIPLVHGNNFLFSCLYEPTLHPEFITYLLKIPEELRHKVFFTTNLAKRIPDDVFEALSASGLHHINISLDSFDPSTYEIFRKGAKFSVFHDNLKRLVNIFSHRDNAPQLFYVSVVNKLNYREIPSLLEQCFTNYLGKFHDIREYWLLTHQKELDWCIDNRLSADELQHLRESLSGLPYDFRLTEAGRDSGSLLPDNNYRGAEVIDEKGWRANQYHNTYDGASIRIQADGKVEILGRNSYFFLQDIASPVSFMSDFCAFLNQDMKKTDEMRRIAGLLIRNSLDIETGDGVISSVDDVFFDPKILTLRGWCFHPDGRKLKIAFQLPGSEAIALEHDPLNSPDVAAVHGPAAASCRFECKVNLNYTYAPEDLMGATLGIGTTALQKCSSAENSLRGRIHRSTKKYLDKLSAR